MLTLNANESRFLFRILEKDFLVISFNASESVSNLYEVKLELAAKDNITIDDFLGKPCLLTIKGDKGGRYFHGMTFKIIKAGYNGSFYLYKVTVTAMAALLELRKDCRIFQDLTVPEIVTQVMKNAVIPPDLYEFRLVTKYPKREYCVQYRETDLRFIKRLLAEEGIFFFFEHQRDRHLMVFGDSQVNYMPIAGNSKICLNPGGSMVAEQEAIIAFKCTKSLTPGSYSMSDYDFEKPSVDLYTCSQAKENTDFACYQYPGNYTDRKHGERLSRVRLEQKSLKARQAKGKSVVVRFVPGFTFRVQDSFTGNIENTYLLTQISHDGQQPQVLAETSSGSQGSSYVNEFTAVPDSVTIRPGFADLKKPYMPENQTAVVTGAKGEEIYTDSYGRVKVQFHWDRYGNYDEKSSCWIRVGQTLAGDGWGSLYIPRIGQQVLVSFFNNDPDRPIITGCLYHGANVAPYKLPEQKTVSTMKSMSSPGKKGFNELRFQDRKGYEQIFIHGEKDMDLRVKNDRRTFTGNNEHTIVENDRYEQINNCHHQIIKSHKIKQVDGSESLTTGRDYQHGAGANYAVKAEGKMHVKAGSSAVFESKESVTLKVGAAFITVDGSGVTFSGADVNLNGSSASPGSVGAINVKLPITAEAAANARPGNVEANRAAAVQPVQIPQVKSAPYIPTPSAALEPAPKASFFSGPQEIKHKLALEIAGTNTRNLAGQFYVFSENGFEKRHGLIGDTDDHRMEIFIDDLPEDDYRLAYEINGMKIPLDLNNALVTCAENEKSDCWETILVPIVPRTYNSIELDRQEDHCDCPRQNGYLYIFVNGFLWRELQAQKQGLFKDVDLANYKTKDERIASGAEHGSILVPFQVNGVRPEIQICFSEVQWSWDQVTALGGMDPEDIRHEKGLQAQPCEDTAKAAEYRSQRLQVIDLKDYPFFDLSSCTTIGFTEETNADGAALRPDLAEYQQAKLPVVYLHDSLAIAESLLEDYHDTLDQFQQVIADLPKLENLKNPDPAVASMSEQEKQYYFKSAALAYRVFFDSQTTANKKMLQTEAIEELTQSFGKGQGNSIFGGGLGDYSKKMSASKRPKIFETCEKQLDRATLEDILQVEKRKDLRTKLRQIKTILAGFLGDTVYEKPATSLHPDFIGVNAMLKDFANLNGKAYGLLWAKANGLYGFLNHEPCAEDPDLDLAKNIAAERPQKADQDPGVAYLNRVLSAEHPMHACLFPPDSPEFDLANPDSGPAPGPEPADGSGHFRPGAFAIAVDESGKDQPADSKIKAAADLTKQSVASLILFFQRQWAALKKTKQTIRLNSLFRLAKATHAPELAQMQTLPPGSVIDLGPDGEHIIAGINSLNVKGVIDTKKDFLNARPGSSTNPAFAQNQCTIYDPKTGKPIGSVNLGQLGVEKYKGAPIEKVTRKQALKLFGQVIEKEGNLLLKTNIDVVVFPKKNEVALKLHNPEYKASPSATLASKGLHAVRKGLPPLVAVLEVMNLSRAAHAFLFQTDGWAKNLSIFAASMAGLTHCTLDAMCAIAGEDAVVNRLNGLRPSLGEFIFKTEINLFGHQVTVFNATAAIISVVSGVLHAWDMIDSISAEDYDSATGYGIAAAGSFALALTTIGASSAKAGTFLFSLGPWGWACMAVCFIGASIAIACKDTDLEKWAKHGPFALDHDDRWTHQYASKDSRFALEGLMGHMLTPSVKMAYTQNTGPESTFPDSVVECYAPGFESGESELVVHTSMEKTYKADPIMGRPQDGPEDSGQAMQTPYRIEQITNDSQSQVIGARFYYKGLGPVKTCRWRTRVRHINKENITLPALLGEKDDYKKTAIETMQKGWVYAELWGEDN
ncbi:MAG: type VI secretion system tip protein VgrG [Desulfobacteraceae bacterium]|nr:type VI secretion system tip protein VgrG [Desulfobacteraceae bacterium]